MNTEPEKLLITTARSQDQDRSRRLHGALTELSFRDENVLYAQTQGVSRNNGRLGFVPAFRDDSTGDLVRSRFGDGSPAPLHVLDGLPERLVAARDANGHVTRTRPGLVSGFIRDGRFYTREEAARATAH